jgi:ribose 5-phosphate isomerase B
MKKREFFKTAGILSAGIFAVPVSGSGQSDARARRIVIGSDHAGFPLKGPVIKLLKSWGHDVKDVGSFTPDPVDFPDIALLLADEIKSGRAERGIMVCGTGVGASIACNKIQGLRAALCHDTYSAHQCVEHDNVNVICIGAQIIGLSVAEEILANFLEAEFSTEEQFRRRVQKLDSFDLVPPKK